VDLTLTIGIGLLALCAAAYIIFGRKQPEIPPMLAPILAQAEPEIKTMSQTHNEPQKTEIPLLEKTVALLKNEIRIIAAEQERLRAELRKIKPSPPTMNEELRKKKEPEPDYAEEQKEILRDQKKENLKSFNEILGANKKFVPMARPAKKKKKIIEKAEKEGAEASTEEIPSL
jgi:hypothetical protein